jgi:hypothetical protein
MFPNCVYHGSRKAINLRPGPDLALFLADPKRGRILEHLEHLAARWAACRPRLPPPPAAPARLPPRPAAAAGLPPLQQVGPAASRPACGVERWAAGRGQWGSGAVGSRAAHGPRCLRLQTESSAGSRHRLARALDQLASSADRRRPPPGCAPRYPERRRSWHWQLVASVWGQAQMQEVGLGLVAAAQHEVGRGGGAAERFDGVGWADVHEEGAEAEGGGGGEAAPWG